MMESVMGNLNLEVCILYLDDIILFSQDFQSHLHRLDMVLTRIEDAGLKLKPSKCDLFKKEIKYLGHIVSRDGIRTDSTKIEKVLNWPIPSNRKQLQKFLGLTCVDLVSCVYKHSGVTCFRIRSYLLTYLYVSFVYKY
jgi:hypothetical protein